MFKAQVRGVETLPDGQAIADIARKHNVCNRTS
jgi:hypothetical protein